MKPNVEPSWKEAWREAIKRLDLSNKAASLAAGLNETFIRDALKKSKSPSIENFVAVCNVLKLDAGALVKEAFTLNTDGIREVPVTGYVEAGIMAASEEWPEDDWKYALMPDSAVWRGKKLYGAETRGPSMNRVYPEGTFIIFNDIVEADEVLMPGKRYVFQRTLVDGGQEFTVKTLHQDPNEKLWLVPDSTDPLFQEATPVEGRPGEEVRIIGRVIHSARDE